MSVVPMSQAAARRSVSVFGDEVLCYDPSVAGVERLLAGLSPGCVAVPVAGEGATDVLEEILAAGRVQILHFLGHGAPGGVYFENAFIDGTVWADVVSRVASRGGLVSLQTINFWSCGTGRGETGMTFLKQVAESTGATVHGSDHKVGSSDLGGSWELNQSVAPLPPFSADARDAFDGVLEIDGETPDPVGGDDGVILTKSPMAEPEGIRVISVGVDTASGTYAPGQAIEFSVELSVAVVSGSSMTLQLSNGDEVLVSAVDDGTSLVSSNYQVSADGYTGTLFVEDFMSVNVSPANPDDGMMMFYPGQDFENIPDTAEITISGTFGNNPPVVTAADVSLNAPPGAVAAGDQVQVFYDSARALEGGADSVDNVTFDLSQFAGTSYVVSYADGGDGWVVDNGVYEYSFILPGAMGGSADPMATTNVAPGAGVDGAYARAFVTVESTTGGESSVTHMVADEETVFVDSVGPRVDSVTLEPGSDTGVVGDQLTSAETLEFRVEFSEPVSGLGVEGFRASGGNVTGVTELPNSVYLVTVDVEDGASLVNVEAESSGIYDGAGNPISAGMGGSLYSVVQIDQVAPTVVQIVRSTDPMHDTGVSGDDGLTNADTLSFNVFTNEAVASGTLTADDFAVTGIAEGSQPTVTVTENSGDRILGHSFTVTVSGDGIGDANSDVGIALSADSSFTDLAGNLAGASADDSAATESYTVDNTAPDAPSVQIMNDTDDTSDYYTSDPSLEVSLPEELNVGTWYSLDGATWVGSSADLGIAADGDYTVYVKRDDDAGNWSESGSVSFTLDTTAPRAVSVLNNTSADTTGVVTFTVQMSEPVRLFDGSDVKIIESAGDGLFSSVLGVQAIGGSADGLSDRFEVDVSYSGEGEISLAIDSLADFIDRAGNQADGLVSVSNPVVVDTNHPSAIITVDEDLVGVGATVGVTVDFGETLPTTAEVIFEALDAPGLSYQLGSAVETADGVYSGTFVAVSGDDATDVRVTLPEGSVFDFNGNSNYENVSGLYGVDSVGPVVTGFSVSDEFSQPGDVYGPWQVIMIEASTSEPVVAGSAIEVTLNNGESVVLSADGLGGLAGHYMVTPDDDSVQGLDVVSYVLGDGTGDAATVPSDGVGNPMVSTVMPQDTIASSQTVTVDTTPPALISIVRAGDEAALTNSSEVVFDVTFDGPVRLTDILSGSDFEATNGVVVSEQIQPVGYPVGGSSFTSFTVPVMATADGDVSLGLALGAQFVDLAGNSSTHDLPDTSAVTVEADGDLVPSYDTTHDANPWAPVDLYDLPVVLDPDASVEWRLQMSGAESDALYVYANTGSRWQQVDSAIGGDPSLTVEPLYGVEYRVGASIQNPLKLASPVGIGSHDGEYQLRFTQTVDGIEGPVYDLHAGAVIAPVGTPGGIDMMSGVTIESYTVDRVADPISAMVVETQGVMDDGLVNDPSAAGINVSGNESGSTVEFSLDDASWSGSYADVAGGMVEGPNNVYVRHTDAAGNVSETTAFVTVDTSPVTMLGMSDQDGVNTTGTVSFVLEFDGEIDTTSIQISDFDFGDGLSAASMDVNSLGASDGTERVEVTFYGVQGEGQFAAAVAASGIRDLAGNTVIYEAGEDRLTDTNVGETTVDTVGPTITAISRAADPDPSYQNDTGDDQADGVTDASSLTFRVDFSETMTMSSLENGFGLVALQGDQTDVASSFTDYGMQVLGLDGLPLADDASSVLVRVSGQELEDFNGLVGIRPEPGLEDQAGNALKGVTVGVTDATGYRLDNEGPEGSWHAPHAYGQLTTLNVMHDSTLVDFVFSEPPASFSYENIVVPAGAQLSGLSQTSDTTWRATLTADQGVDVSSFNMELVGITDQFGNPSEGPTGINTVINITTVVPVVSVSLSQTTVKAGDTVTVTVTSSKPLIEVVESKLVAPNLTATSEFTTSPPYTEWTATYVVDQDIDDTTSVATLLARGAIDEHVNLNLADVVSNEYRVDTVSPLITGISRTDSELTNDDQLVFRVDFSEPVDMASLSPTGFEVVGDGVALPMDDYTVSLSGDPLSTHGAAMGDSGTITGYSDHVFATVTGVGVDDFDGTIGLVPSSDSYLGFTDEVGNASDNSGDGQVLAADVSPEAYTLDNSLAHTVSIDPSVMRGGDTATVTVVFGEPPVDISQAAFALDGQSAAGLIGPLVAADETGLVYTATFTAPSDTEITDGMLTLGGYTDAAGNLAGDSQNETFVHTDLTVDNIAPAGTSQVEVFEGWSGMQKTGAVREGDSVQLRFSPQDGNDIASVVFDVGDLTGLREINLTTGDTWTESDFNALRAHMNDYIYHAPGVEAAKDAATDAFEALYRVDGVWDGSPWNLAMGTLATSTISFNNGVEDFTLEAGNEWTHELITAFEGAWMAARYDSQAVKDARNDAETEFKSTYADAFRQDPGDEVLSDVSFASQTVEAQPETHMVDGSGGYMATIEVPSDGVNYENIDVTVLVTDHAGNTFTDVAASLLVDNQAPNAELIDGSSATDTGVSDQDNITNADVVEFTVVFDEPVTHVGMDDFTVSSPNDDIVGAEVSKLERVDDTTYLVTVSGGNLADGDGDLVLAIEPGIGMADIYDRAGNHVGGHQGSVTVDNTVADPVISVSSIINDAESGSVEVTLGLDSDIDQASVSVTLTDGTSTVTAAPKPAAPGVYVADASGLADGSITVDVAATDVAGNQATADAQATLDTTLTTPTVTVGEVTVNASESGGVTLTVSGVDADAATVAVTLTDSGGSTVDATAVSDDNGDWTVDLSAGALADGQISAVVQVTDVAGNTASSEETLFDLDTTINTPTVTLDSLINYVETGAVEVTLGLDSDIADADVMVQLTDGQQTIDASPKDGARGVFVADVSGLEDGQITVNVTASDSAENVANVGTSFTLDTSDTSADIDGDFGLAVDSVVNRSEAGSMQITLSGIDPDVAVPDGVVVSVGDLDMTQVAAAQGARDAVATDILALNSELASLQATAGNESDYLGELEGTLTGLQSSETQLLADQAAARAARDSATADLAALKAELPDLEAFLWLEQQGLADLNTALETKKAEESAKLSEKQQAQADYDTAVVDLADLNAELPDLQAISVLEQLGVTELSAALIAAQAVEGAKLADKQQAQADYDAAYAEARSAFVGSNADPALLSDGDPVAEPINTPSVVIDADAVAGGATWTQAQIDGLATDLDSFVANYTWPDAQGQTVEQLENALADATAQHTAAAQQVTELTVDRDTYQGVADAAQTAVTDKQAEIVGKQAELDATADDLADLDAQLGAIQQDVADATSDRDTQQGVADAAQTAVTDKQGEIAGKQSDLDGATDALAGIDSQLSTVQQQIATATSDRDTQQGVSDAAQTAVTDKQAEVSAKQIELDTATEALDALIQSSLSGSGVTATHVSGSVWEADVSGLPDGVVSVRAEATDGAGNVISVASDFTLDQVADVGGDLNAVFLSGGDAVLNSDEAADGAIHVTGFGTPDLQSVATTVTDGTYGLTLTASPADTVNNVPVGLAASVVGYEGDLTIRLSSDLAADAVSATEVVLVAQYVSGGPDGVTHVVDFDSEANLGGSSDVAALLTAGAFYAQAYDADGASMVSNLTDQTNLSVSVAVTDVNGNTDTVSASDVALLDQTADVGADFGLTVGSFVNGSESGSAQITLSGIDGDVDVPGNIVVSISNSDAEAIASARTAKEGIETELAGLNAELSSLQGISGLEQLGVTELSAALIAAQAVEGAKLADKQQAQADYDAAYAEARSAFVGSNADPALLSDGDPVAEPINTPSVVIDADAVAGGATWTQAQIDGLATDLDSFVANYTWPDAQGQTVEQLENALADATAQHTAAAQQVTELTVDRDTYQGVADAAQTAVTDKQAEVTAKQAEFDSASATYDALMAAASPDVTATHVSGNVWQADLSGFEDGLLTVTAALTDAAGNTADADASFTLDTSADTDSNFAVSVSADDLVTNASESTDVSLSLDGIDGDAVSVSVDITDGTNTVSADASYHESTGWTVADQDLNSLADGSLTVNATVIDAAGNTATADATLEKDTAVAPPVTLLVSDAHADMTAAEAATAMTVTVEDGSAWSVTLTGTRNEAALIDQDGKTKARDAAQADKEAAQSAYDSLSGELPDLQATLSLEQQRLAEKNAALEGFQAVESGIQDDVNAAQQAYDSGYAEGRSEFVTLAADPETIQPDDVADATIEYEGQVLISEGEAWTDSLIATLSQEMEVFVAAYTPLGDTHTVADLASELADANAQLSVASANVATAVADRDTQQGVTDAAQALVDAKQAEVDSASATLDTEIAELAAAQGDLDAADAEVNASIVTKAGTGTGSAQVVGLDADDLAALGEGPVTVSSVATDPVGNADSDGTTFTLDTTPDVGSDFAVSVATDDQLTNAVESADVSLSFAGIDADAASVAVDITDGTNTVSADASYDESTGWTVTDQDLSGLADGSLTVNATVTDIAGNTAAASASFTLDTTPDVGSDFAVSVATDDQLTNAVESADVSLSFAGIDADAASVAVDITDGTNTVSADASYDESTGWTVTDQDLSGLADGSLTVNATVTDIAGNTAAASASFTLDTTPDVGSDFAVSVATDDQLTNAVESTDVSLSFAGIDADAASVAVDITDGTNTVSADASYDESTGWTVTDQDLSGLADGSLTVNATVTDIAGNTAAASASFTLDTTAPEAPSIDSWSTDTNITDDGITSDNTLTLTVTGRHGDARAKGVGDPILTAATSRRDHGTPRLYVDSAHIEAQADTDNYLDGSHLRLNDPSAGGTGYSWTEDAPGVYTVATDELDHGFAGDLTVTITDTAGNESAHSNAVAVEIDTVAPAKPVIESVVEDTNITDDDITSDNTLTLTVAGESGATLTLLQDDTEIVPVSVTDNGDGTYTVVTDVISDVSGSALSVTLTDTAGNVSEVSDSYLVTVDTVAPGTPTVVLLNDSHNHADQAGDGSSESDNLTKFDVLQLELTGEPSGTVTVFDGGTAMVDAVVEENAAGVYSVTTVALADGQHDLSFTVMDTAGNVSSAAQLSVTVDTAAPVAPSIGLVNDTLGDADQGDTDTDQITKDSTLTLTVTGESGGLLIIEDNDLELVPQSVTDNGDDTYTVVTGELAGGAHALTVKIRDDAGNVSDAGELTVTVDTSAPVVTIDSVGADGVVQDNESGADHTISGTGEVGRLVELAFPVDGDPAANHTVTTMVLEDGSWSYTLNNEDMVAIGQGTGRSVVATQVDVAGNVFSTDPAGFEMYTTTRIDADGVLDEAQLSANLGHPDTVEGGTVVTGAEGTLAGAEDVLDLSGSSSDVRLESGFGTIMVDNGVTVRSAYTDPDGDFETILTGSGNDLLIGLDGVSEVFNPGAGNNTVIAGDSAGDYDELDYSQMSGASGSLGAVASADVADGKEYTLGTNWKQSELVVLNLNGQSFAAPTAQYATLAALVVALEQQVEAAVGGDIVSMVTNDVTNTVTVTANAGTDQAAVVAALQASEIVAIDIGGIYADLSLSASQNVYAAYTGETGKVLRNDGGSDEVLGIEGVLGTAYEDILAGDDLENYLAAGAGDDILAGEGGSDELLGGEGNDYIYGGDGDDYIVGGAGTDILFGGSGRDVYAVDLGSVDTIRDFGVSSILSSAAGRGGVNDQVEFGFTDVDLDGLFGSVPGSLGLSLSLTSVSDHQYTLVLTGDDGDTTATLGTVDLNWGTVEALFGDLDPAAFNLNAFLPAGGTLVTGDGDYSVLATLEFVREAQVDDEAGSQVVIGEGTSDDIFVSTQGDDIVIGGLGEDTYETRILGETGETAIDNGTETLNDLGGVGEVDTVFFEGVRDLGDLVFDRVELRREGDDRSLEIRYEQYRGLDDEDTSVNEIGALHATGTVELFNQFSLSQSDLYAIEGLQIAAETDNPLEAAVQSYVFGRVTESAETGDTLTATAGENTILIGSGGKNDQYVVDMTGVSEDTEVWIYGMDSVDGVDANDSVTISQQWSTATQADVVLAGGETVQKVSMTFDGSDAVLDLFFADGGNVNSTDLIDRIKFES